jgi:hypothetical protein
MEDGGGGGCRRVIHEFGERGGLPDSLSLQVTACDSGNDTLLGLFRNVKF